MIELTFNSDKTPTTQTIKILQAATKLVSKDGSWYANYKSTDWVLSTDGMSLSGYINGNDKSIPVIAHLSICDDKPCLHKISIREDDNKWVSTVITPINEAYINAYIEDNDSTTVYSNNDILSQYSLSMSNNMKDLFMDNYSDTPSAFYFIDDIETYLLNLNKTINSTIQVWGITNSKSYIDFNSIDYNSKDYNGVFDNVSKIYIEYMSMNDDFVTIYFKDGNTKNFKDMDLNFKIEFCKILLNNKSKLL